MACFPGTSVAVRVHQSCFLLFQERIGSVSRHSLPPDNDPRRITQPTYQPVLPIVRPPAFCRRDSIDALWFTGIRRELERGEAREERRNRRRAVFRVLRQRRGSCWRGPSSWWCAGSLRSCGALGNATENGRQVGRAFAERFVECWCLPGMVWYTWGEEWIAGSAGEVAAHGGGSSFFGFTPYLASVE